jgi:hypothetical protein
MGERIEFFKLDDAAAGSGRKSSAPKAVKPRAPIRAIA